MGKDSAATLARWLTDPSCRDFPLSDLTVVTAMTGDEPDVTRRLMEDHLLPLMRRTRTRFVQIARAEQHGNRYVVLDDSRRPRRMIMQGPWRLSDELRASGTVPQVASRRRLCSWRAKGSILDAWYADEYGGAPFRHVVCFAAEEARRAARDQNYTAGARRPEYPLIESWNWDRVRCDLFLLELFGEPWSRSACGYCLMWNLLGLVCPAMTTIFWDRYPRVADHEHARRWLQFTANIGRAANTVDAYGRSLDDHLKYCERVQADPLTLRADTVAGWIGDLRERPNPRSSKLVHFDSGAGLANSTIQLRIVAARSFYAFLVEDGLRELNPVRRGQSGRGGRKPKRGLVRRVEAAPWIPHETAWEAIIAAVIGECLRNRLMVALAYDGALRREELTCLEIDDFEPAYSLIHLRAETTKSQRAREVAYGQATGQLLMAYLRQRREMVGRTGGRLLLSESRRNFAAPLTVWTWSNIVEAISVRAQVANLSTHTFRHLRLTDLARAGWTLDQIAQYAGHRDLDTTLKYIHLSGRELAAQFHRSISAVHAARERLLAGLVATR